MKGLNILQQTFGDSDAIIQAFMCFRTVTKIATNECLYIFSYKYRQPIIVMLHNIVISDVRGDISCDVMISSNDVMCDVIQSVHDVIHTIDNL